jgi:hypothetical protein
MMKKRFSKKLSLTRETVRNFEDHLLGNAMGGASLANSCDPVSVRICPSEGCTTTSSLCTLESNCC